MQKKLSVTRNACATPIEYPILYSVVMVIELHVPWAQPVAPYKLFVPGRALVLCISSEHALDTHADALHVLNWTPTLSTEEIQADDAICIDMRMHGNWSIGKFDESDLGRFYEKPLVRFI
jgi:hypothetical protein